MWPGVVFFDFILFGCAEPLKSVNVCFSSNLVWFEVLFPQTLFCVSISFSPPCWTSMTCVSSLFAFVNCHPPHPRPPQPQVSEALLIFISSLYFNWEVFPGLWSRWKTDLSSISSILLCPFSEFVFSDILFFSPMFFFLLVSFFNPASLLRMSSF